jgi:hypothetical protein
MEGTASRRRQTTTTNAHELLLVSRLAV